jgi:hypothetical protein
MSGLSATNVICSAYDFPSDLGFELVKQGTDAS